MPTPQQRKAQFDAVRSAIDTSLTARLNADASAAKAGSEADQINSLRNAYVAASQAYAAGTGSGAAVDAARSAFFAVANVQGADTQQAQSDYVAFTTDYQALQAAVQALLVDPGVQERV